MFYPNNGNIENPKKSLPFCYRLEGNKGYRNKLKDATKALYRMMRESPVLDAKIGHVTTVGKNGYRSLPKVPKLEAGKPENIIALEHLLHSIAHLWSRPTTVEKGIIRDNLYVAIPFAEEKFAKDPNLSHISATAFRNMVVCLCSFALSETDQPWLFFVPSKHDSKTGTTKFSRIRPSDEFADWLTQQGLVFGLHPHGGKHEKKKVPNGLILLNIEGDENDEGHARAKPLQRDLVGHETILPALNEALFKQTLTFPINNYQKDYRSHWSDTKGSTRFITGGQRNLYRVFKPRDGVGGRLNGHFVQTLPKDIRKIMLIGGKPVVELDYSSMQLRLLYGIKGVPLPDQSDFYAHPNYADWPEENRQMMRDDMKMVLTRSVGCATRAKTIGSLQNTLQENNKKNPRAKAEEMYDQFWGMHPLVCPHDAEHPTWGILQKVESDIALHVLANLLGQGITAIPVHDSFIVQREHNQALYVTMLEAAQEIVPNIEFEIS